MPRYTPVPVDAETRLNAYASLIDARLEELLPPAESEPIQLHSAMRYSCLAPGKRLRPALCLASAEAIGAFMDLKDPIDSTASSGAVVDAACALEMVHCFSLIHDDLPSIDNDDLRRGAPTCHVQFGEAIALLAGDALFSLAFEVLAYADGPADRAVLALRILSRATGSDGLVGGEVLDVLAEGANVNAGDLARIHSLKTGALIAASCEIGGVLAGGTEEQILVLRSFGAKIGIGFQIVDDILNETSTADQLGKAPGTDRARGKATYPALFGLAGSTAEVNRLFQEAVDSIGACIPHPEGLKDLARLTVSRKR